MPIKLTQTVARSMHLAHSYVTIAPPPLTTVAKPRSVLAQFMATLRRRWSPNKHTTQHHSTSNGGGPQQLQLTFTCNLCNTSNARLVQCEAYRKGLVVLECDGCQAKQQVVRNMKWIARDTGDNR